MLKRNTEVKVNACSKSKMKMLVVTILHFTLYIFLVSHLLENLLRDVDLR